MPRKIIDPAVIEAGAAIARLEGHLREAEADGDTELADELRTAIDRIRKPQRTRPPKWGVSKLLWQGLDRSTKTLAEVQHLAFVAERVESALAQQVRIREHLIAELIPAKRAARTAEVRRVARAKTAGAASAAAARKREAEDAQLQVRALAMKRRNPALSASQIAQFLSNELGRSISRVRVGRWLR